MSEKIDLSSIQYIPQELKDDVDKNIVQKDEKDMEKIVKKAKIMKKAMDKENEKVENVDKETEMKDRYRMILTLKFYVLEFGDDKLSQYKKTKFDKMTLEQLIDMRKEMDMILSSKGTMKKIQNLILTSIQYLELGLTLFTPIQCQGLYKSIESDQEAIDDIKHISLKHMGVVCVEPEYRLGMKILESANALNLMNKSMQKSNIQLEQVNNKYSDL